MSRIAGILAGHFPGNDSYAQHLGKLLSAYNASGLADAHFVEEIETGDEHKLWARVWEAMLYDHLLSLDSPLDIAGMTKLRGRGPDFKIVHQRRNIWIEAVTPSPKDIPLDYLEPPERGEVKFKLLLDDESLLRWTAVLSAKRQKLGCYKKTEHYW
jgi:hypothetical protein